MVLGPEESVLIREVSLFQGLKSTQTQYLKKVSGVLISGMSYRGVPLYTNSTILRVCLLYIASWVFMCKYMLLIWNINLHEHVWSCSESMVTCTR